MGRFVFYLLAGAAVAVAASLLAVAEGAVKSSDKVPTPARSQQPDVHFMVQVEYTLRDGRNKIISKSTCGGVLLTTAHVVTCAHCVVANLTHMTVYSGTALLWKKGSGGMAHQVRSAQKHPKYQIVQGAANTKFVYDVAVLRLQDSVELGTLASTIAIVKPHHNVLASRDVTVAGWGLRYFSDDDIKTKLRVLNLGVMSQAACSQERFANITSDQFCVSSAPHMGNSGSAAFRGAVLYGLMSWGSNVFANLAEPETNSFVTSMLQKL